MKLSTEEFLSGALDLTMMAGGLAFHTAKIMVTRQNMSHAAASACAAQKWRSAMKHFEYGREYRKKGE